MLPLDISYKIVGNDIHRTIDNSKRDTSTTIPSRDFFHQMSHWGSFTTGWLPPIVRYHSQFMGYSQTCIVLPPSVNLVWWGKHENDATVKQYELAFPWRVIIFDFYQDSFRGARMFYSPVPINSPHQTLYNANVPNINCRGYQGNAVGWLCLYHTDKTSNMTLQERIDYVIHRCSGGEAYNDANMNSTDGTRYYASYSAPNFLTDPAQWEKKTQEEGVQWTLDPNLWLPVIVSGVNKQDKNTTNRQGIELSIAMAIEGRYAAYYNVGTEFNPAQLMRRGETSFDSSKLLNHVFAAAGKHPTPIKLLAEIDETFGIGAATPKKSCIHCGRSVRTDMNACSMCRSKKHECPSCMRSLDWSLFESLGDCKNCIQDALDKEPI